LGCPINTRIVGPGLRRGVQRASYAALAISAAAMAVGGLRLMKLRSELSDLKTGTAGRQARLRENRRSGVILPKGPKPDALDRSRAVSKLRSTLSKLASERGFSVDEFQAGTDEMPYLTVYASENNDPGWMQVSVRALLRGKAPVLAAAVTSLRSLEVPFEIDNLEMTRRTSDGAGRSIVTEQIQMRLLVYRGEG